VCLAFDVCCKKIFYDEELSVVESLLWNCTGAVAAAKLVMMYLFEFRAASLDHNSDSSCCY